MTRVLSLEDFVNYLHKARKKSGDHLLESTIETYTRLVTDLFSGDALQLPFDDLVVYLNKEIKKYQNPVLMSAYRAVLKYMGYDNADCKKLVVEFNLAVASRSKRFLQSKVLSKKEILKLLDYLKTIREKLIICMLYDTCCRRDELLNIKMCDIDFLKREITLLGKGEIHRTVYYTSSTEKLLLEHIHNENLKKDSSDLLFVFYNKAGEIVKHNDNALWKWLRDASALALGRHIHPHCFRHTGATHLADEGADILDIKAYLGHSSIQTSMIYIELGSFRRKDAFTKYKKDLNEESPHEKSDKKIKVKDLKDENLEVDEYD
jgi:integrase